MWQTYCRYGIKYIQSINHVALLVNSDDAILGLFLFCMNIGSQPVSFIFTLRLESPDAMFKSGLYINDLSMHDSSRDLVLAGTQQSAELKLALDQVRKPAAPFSVHVLSYIRLQYPLVHRPPITLLHRALFYASLTRPCHLYPQLCFYFCLDLSPLGVPCSSHFSLLRIQLQRLSGDGILWVSQSVLPFIIPFYLVQRLSIQNKLNFL